MCASDAAVTAFAAELRRASTRSSTAPASTCAPPSSPLDGFATRHRHQPHRLDAHSPTRSGRQARAAAPSSTSARCSRSSARRTPRPTPRARPASSASPSRWPSPSPRDGIRVNALAPGWIETPMTAVPRANPARSAELVGRTPMGRWGTPDDLVGRRAVPLLAARRLRHRRGPAGRRRLPGGLASGVRQLLEVLGAQLQPRAAASGLATCSTEVADAIGAPTRRLCRDPRQRDLRRLARRSRPLTASSAARMRKPLSLRYLLDHALAARALVRIGGAAVLAAAGTRAPARNSGCPKSPSRTQMSCTCLEPVAIVEVELVLDASRSARSPCSCEIAERLAQQRRVLVRRADEAHLARLHQLVVAPRASPPAASPRRASGSGRGRYSRSAAACSECSTSSAIHLALRSRWPWPMSEPTLVNTSTLSRLPRAFIQLPMIVSRLALAIDCRRCRSP